MNRQFTVHFLRGSTQARTLPTSAQLFEVLRDEFGIGGLAADPPLLSRLDALP
jgi:hypothetical protein